MMPRKTLLTAFGFIALLAAGASITYHVHFASMGKQSGDPALRTGFAPHRALYNIKLVETKSGSQVVNISGQMFYEWHPTCGGWISNHRFNLFYEYADTPPMQVSSDFSNFESFDGRKLDYTSQRKRNGSIFEEIRGYAEQTGGNKGLGTYTIPKGLTYDLPEGTLFPMMHSLEVLKAAHAGDKFYSAVIFDGSDEDGPSEVNAFIGAETKPVIEANKNIDETLLDSPARKIRLAFFPLKESSSSSDYEMDLVFHDNSVISDMLVEYDDFTIHQSLAALEKLEGGCEEEENEKIEDLE